MQIAFMLYPGFTALDAIGPFDVLGSVPGHEPVFVAEEVGPVRNDSDTVWTAPSRHLTPQGVFADSRQAAETLQVVRLHHGVSHFAHGGQDVCDQA